MTTAVLEPRMVSAKTLSPMCDIKENTLRKWGREGKLPCKIVCGSLMRFDLEGTRRILGLNDKD